MTSRVLLLQDIVQLQTAYWTNQNIQNIKFEYLIYPSHSTGLIPSEFQEFNCTQEEQVFLK